MKELLIRGPVSESMMVGKTLREARERGDDPAAAVAKALNAWVLFRGKVSRKEWEDKQGYYWGSHTISGSGEFAGHEFKIWFKNENHISWLDGKPYVTSPDIIQVIQAGTGEPITNPMLSEGEDVAVVGVRKRRAFATKEGVAAVGPAHYGFDIEHRPIEEVVNRGDRKHG